MQRFRSAASGIALIACLLASPAQSLTISGIDFSDYLLVDLAAGADLTLSTSGDIYVQAPGTLTASALDVDAAVIHVNIDLDVSGIASLCTLPACFDQPATIFQDVVIRIQDFAGALELDAGGSIVIDAVPIPEPSSLGLVLVGMVAFAFARGRSGRF